MNAEYVISAMLLFSIVGMCIKIFFGNETSKDGSFGRANSTIWGYGLVAISVLTVMFVSFALHAKINTILNSGIFQFLKTFLTSSGPAMLTIITLMWILSLSISYFKPINKGTASKEYYQLSTGTSFLFVFQLICLFQYLNLTVKMMKNEQEPNDKVAQTRYTFATYFIGAINLIVVGMMTILLEFFSTDG